MLMLIKFLLLTQIINLQQMQKSEETLTTTATVHEWPAYAKLLFSTNTHQGSQIPNTTEEEIVCSPSPNATFSQTKRVNFAEEEAVEKSEDENEYGNAFFDFINKEKQEIKKGNSKVCDLMRVVCKNEEQLENREEEEMLEKYVQNEDLRDDQLQIVSSVKLLSCIYNNQYIETQISQQVKILQSKPPKMQILVTNFFIKQKSIQQFESIHQAASNSQQFKKQKYMACFDKEQGTVYCSKGDLKNILSFSIPFPEKFSKSICVDSTSLRFFLFNNQKSEIYIHSFTEGKLLCRLQCFVTRLNPNLYFHEEKRALFVVGGYESDTRMEISPQIEMYKMSGNSLQLQPILFSLNISRFRSLISQFTIDNKNYLLIVGGIHKASTIQSSVVFNQNLEQNKTSNSTAQIIDLQSLKICMVSVCANQVPLNSGYSIVVNNQQLILLPQSALTIKFVVKGDSNGFNVRVQRQPDCLPSYFDKYFKKSSCKLLSNDSIRMSKTNINRQEREQICQKLHFRNGVERKYCCPLI